MKYVRLGDSGLNISALGLGCMGMSEFYGPHNETEALDAIDRAIEVGINFLDTADAYGNGANEELVGKAIRRRRDQVIIATKFGNVRDQQGRFVRIDGSRAYVRQACEASLRRLGIDTIDLYYQHRVDRETPIEETVGEMSRLVAEGKVRHLGLSEAGVETIRRAHRTAPITALQTEYSLWSRDPESQILPLCRELGISFVAYSPLGRGFLTGRIKRPEDLASDDWRRKSPRFQGVNFEANLEIVRRVEALAGERGCSAAQLALAWLLSHEGVVPLFGAKRRQYVEENVKALDVVLSAADVKRIEKAAPAGAAAGDRYPEQGMKAVGG